jgi:lactate dehydrogenase-like 2-hydroxyacid dehydrogenase
MQKLQIIVLGTYSEVIENKLSKYSTLTWIPANSVSRSELVDRFRKISHTHGPVDAVIVMEGSLKFRPFDRTLLDSISPLRCLIKASAGYDMVDVKWIESQGGVVGHCPNAVREPTAIGAFTMILAITRTVLAVDKNVREGQWRNGCSIPFADPRDQVLGIVGAGSIGKVW